VSAYVLVIGHGPDLEAEDSAASLLRNLGANVHTLDYFDDASPIVEREHGAARAIVVEAGERPDLAVAALRQVRRIERLASTPALVSLSERQIARLDPSSNFDDFVVAPCRPVELYARIRQLEWRSSEFSTEERVKVGSLVIDRAARDVFVDGRLVTLTSKEFDLLAMLAQHRGRVLSRETLLARVWGSRYEGGARTVDIHVRRLRMKLGGALPLETMRGAGYKLRAPSKS
jgi:DNA-binding response OmpR family regulator